MTTRLGQALQGALGWLRLLADRGRRLYHDTYGSTLPITPVRLFFAAACINDWDITEIDTAKAFTQAVFDNEEKLYIEQPHYMEVDDPNVKGCLMLCPLEGCKQASFLYQKAVRLPLTSSEMNYTQSMT